MTKKLPDKILIRPVISADVDDLLDMVERSSGGLSSLQPRHEFLLDYIQTSEKSFSGQYDLEDPHKYLLGMFVSGELIGCAAVKTQIGVGSPFINFDIIGDGLDQYLVASSRFTGATEVGSLFLHPDYRAYGLGKYLAKVRYLLMAAEPWRFGDTVIAELRGICGAEGSPLYDYLFKNKLERTFLEADEEYFDRNPDKLGDIVPIGRIDVSGFPMPVRASLAQPHPSGAAAYRMLQKEGFIFSGTIDLFDAGPIVYAYRDTIRTIMNRKEGAILPVSSISGGQPYLISAGEVENFRAIVCPAQTGPTGLLISELDYAALALESGESVFYWKNDASLRDTRKGPVKAQI
ncbi:MAG: hypothetical protein HKN36_09500 [Hellea sp.]|nr:hypothetical protein [Hellea sp.]